MINLVNCKKCGSKAYIGYGHELTKSDEAYVFCEVVCSNDKCENYIKVMFSPGVTSTEVAEVAAEVWNKKNGKASKKKKRCSTCDNYVDVGYKGKKKCLKGGVCDE